MDLHIGIDKLFGFMARVQQLRVRGVEDTQHWMPLYQGAPLASLFPAPEARPWARKGRRLQRAGMHIQSYLFKSGHLPLHPRKIERYKRSYQSLHLFRVCRFRKSGTRPKRAMIYLPPWMQPGSLLDDLYFGPLYARALDCDVYCLQLAHHGQRQIPGSSYDGAHFVSANLAMTYEAIRQSVLDARTVLQFLENSGRYSSVGLSGISLGGSLAMLCAGVESRFSWVLPVVGHMDVADIIEHAPIMAGVRRDLQRFGIPLSELHRLNRELVLERLQPALPANQICVVAGDRDLFQRPQAIHEQMERWPGMRCEWLPGGHISALGQLPRTLQSLRPWLLASGSRKIRAV